jgi:kynurenine formamidase
MIRNLPGRRHAFDIIIASMARVPRFLDVSVALAPGIPTDPGNPAVRFDPVQYEMDGLPLRVRGADRAPARVVLRR